MKNKRGFEIVSNWQAKGIKIPVRKTAASAGYDLAAAITVTIAPQAIVLVPTGIKAYMQDDEVLEIYIRSSLAIKKQLRLANNVGIIDADYYDNESNEGHIMLAMYNFGKETVTLKQGERIAQGIFKKYLLTDGDNAGAGDKRQGGFGSTGSD